MGDFRLGKTAVLGKAPVSTGFKLGMGKVPQCMFGVHINEPTGNIMALHDAFRGKEFQPNDAGLDGYPYRAEIAYNPSVGGSEGYQFLVKTYYAEDAEHGGDAENVNGIEVIDGEPSPIPKIYLNRLCRWDFGDVRFQLKGVVGASAYTYRLIEKVDGVWALFLFKSNENPDGGLTVCCYWGKQTATDESSDAAAEAIIPNVVGAWPLDEAAATDPAVDYSGNGNHGAATGTTIVQNPKFIGKTARKFTGYDGITSPFKIADHCPNAQSAVVILSQASNPYSWTGILTFDDVNQRDFYFVTRGSPALGVTYGFRVTPDESTEHEFAATANTPFSVGLTIDKTEKIGKAYANGALVRTFDRSAASSFNSATRNYMSIGRRDISQRASEITVCGVYVFNRVLSEQEMSAFNLNIYPDPYLIAGSVLCRKWASTTLPTVASVSSMQTRKSYGKQELYPSMDNLNFTLDQANKKASVEFYLENTATESANILVLNDDEENFWTLERQGEGTLDLTIDETADSPCVLNGKAVKLTFNATTGTYGLVGMSHQYATNLDLSAYDFVSFYWVGTNSGNTYELGLSVDTAFNTGNKLYYQFTDNWIGNKLFILPIKALAVAGVNPSNAIRCIWFKRVTLVADAVAYLDRFKADTGVWAKVEIGIPDKLQIHTQYASQGVHTVDWEKWQIYTHNGSTYVLSMKCETGTLANIIWDSVNTRFLDTKNMQTIYGEQQSWSSRNSAASFIKGKRGETKGRKSTHMANQTITYNKAKTKYRVGFAIKMPPADLHASATSGIGQCRLKLEVYYQ
jgi:hypothetical protein